MSYEDFVKNITDTLKINVTESITKNIMKNCSTDTINTQMKIVVFDNVTSHYTRQPIYDKNIDCSTDFFKCMNTNIGLTCDRNTKKCVPVNKCIFTTDQNQQINVNENCIGETSSFLSSSNTIDTNTGNKVQNNYSLNNHKLQKEFYSALEKMFPNKEDSYLIQAINKVFINTISDVNVSQQCKNDVIVVQNQYLKVRGDIYCDPDSRFVISQNSNIQNYVNCIFNDINTKLLSDPVVSKLYVDKKNNDCVCDKKILGNCINNKRKIKNTIIKQATGIGTCNCDVNQTEEYCEIILKNPSCLTSEWSDWSLCNEGKQFRNRKILFGSDNCADTNQLRYCDITKDSILSEFKSILNTYLYVFIFLIILFCIFIIFK